MPLSRVWSIAICLRYAHAVLYQGAADTAGGRSFIVAEAD